MPWFKVDDNLAFHHKAVAAGNAAMGMWVRCGALCANQLTDGFVPDHMVPMIGTRSLAKKLVAVGLWTEVEGGYRFHEWDERQPTRSDVEAQREAAKERMRVARERKRSQSVRANSERTSGEVLEKFAECSHNPDPTRPDPTRPDRESTTAPDGASLESFESFWTGYPRRNGIRVGRKDALAQWSKLSESDRNLALAAVKHYGSACDRGLTLAKDAHRWLRGRCWVEWESPVAGADPSQEWA